MRNDRAYMVLPLAATIVDADWQPTAPASNLLNDEMGRVWQSLGNQAVLTFNVASPVDVVALVGTNLLASDTVRVQAGHDTNFADYDSGTLPAWSGTKADWISAKFILRLDAPVNYPHWKLTINTSQPHVEAARLCAGQCLSHIGVDSEAQVSAYDQSDVTQGAGWQRVVEYPTTLIWKVSFDQIENEAWMSSWLNFVGSAGNRRCILFVPDDLTPEYRQNLAVFGTVTGEAPGKSAIGNFWSMEVTIRARKA